VAACSAGPPESIVAWSASRDRSRASATSRAWKSDWSKSVRGCLHEKHSILLFFLGGPPPAGASVEREPGSAEALSSRKTSHPAKQSSASRDRRKLCLHEKHRILRFFLGGTPPAGASVASCHAIVEREPGLAEARRALEFRPAEVCPANTPNGESPREGDFCRPGGAAHAPPATHHSSMRSQPARRTSSTRRIASSTSHVVSASTIRDRCVTHSPTVFCAEITVEWLRRPK